MTHPLLVGCQLGSVGVGWGSFGCRLGSVGRRLGSVRRRLGSVGGQILTPFGDRDPSQVTMFPP